MYTDDTLWDYADGLLEATEAKQLADAIRKDATLRQRWEAISAQRSSWASTPLDKPKASFTDSVMAAWTTEQHTVWTQTHTTARDKAMVYGLAAGFSTLICGGLLFIIIGALRSVSGAAPEVEAPTSQLNLDWLSQIHLPNIVLYVLCATFAIAAIHLVERLVRYRRIVHTA